MNMIIEEEVLVSDIPIIEEQVFYPSNPISVEEEVLVPATIPAPNEVEKVIDPAWRDYVFNLEYTAISREAIVDIFNQLPDFTGQSTRNMSLVGSPYASELTEEDLKIAINKNWVINR